MSQDKTEVEQRLDSQYPSSELIAGSAPHQYIESNINSDSLLAKHKTDKNSIEGGLRFKGICKRSLPGKPLISVITVSLNSASTIEETIRSVLNQTYDNIEYIIIDGGSTDGTVEVIKKYESAIAYWISEKDQGIYDAMNKGISLCSGKYVGMLNADDMFSGDNVMRDIADRFCSTEVDAVFSCLNIVDRNNLTKILRKYRVAKFTPTLLRIGVMPPHPTFYCKKSCYEQGSAYRTDYKIAADFEMLTRLLIKQKISWSFIDKVMVTMRSGGLSNSGLMAKTQLNLEIVRACKENGLYTNFVFLLLKLPIRLFELIR
jgi:glycosyltransferase involved in cell wall biosynthesis